jgi:4-alpha-glucanotransferase
MRNNQRLSGILLHPTSLPSPYGIGDLGKSAYEFVDFLAESGQHLWQLLPLTHTGFGDSPYQSFSAFAGQPLLISPDHLLELGLVSKDDLTGCPVSDEEHVDYGAVIPWKQHLYETAYQNFLRLRQQPSVISRESFSGDTVGTDASEFSSDVVISRESFPELVGQFEQFCREEAYWLDDYALFMACKDANNGVSWLDWPEEYRMPTDAFLWELRGSLSERVGFYQFLQFFFYKEWLALKAYANEKQIQIIGDIPIFVSMDSADVWAHKHLFQLDSRGYPQNVAGVPPDYFSATGQLWGNPLYNWDVHKQEGFAWWIARIHHQLQSLDILRIDHFRGFEAYWAIPYGEETAINGQWIKSPGYDLFYAIQHALGEDLPIIAEDLGIITDEVTALREHFHFPGMKVLQFAFDSLSESDYLPHRFTSPECVCYTGTHDNDTTVGWFGTLNADCQEKVCQYTCKQPNALISHSMIRTCISSIAMYAIFPMQDVLGCGSEGRMNTPGVAGGNWSWRYKKGALTSSLAKELKNLTILYGRN